MKRTIIKGNVVHQSQRAVHQNKVYRHLEEGIVGQVGLVRHNEKSAKKSIAQSCQKLKWVIESASFGNYATVPPRFLHVVT